jgi:glycosyltransferase involved in cell wall biosynthesis
MSKPKVSVITTVYNKEDTLQRCIDSVDYAINNRPPLFEVEHVLVDDASSDDSSRILKKNKKGYRKIVKHKSNCGVNQARKTGIEKSQGEYVLMLDADDEFTPDALWSVFETIKMYPKNKIFFFEVHKINARDERWLMSKFTKPFAILRYYDYLEKKSISGETMSLVHRSVYKKAMYNPDNFAFESIFWNKAIRSTDSFMTIPIATRLYHSDGGNAMSSSLHKPENYIKRICDFEDYIEEFRWDYYRYGLGHLLDAYYMKLGFYLALAGAYPEARCEFKEAFEQRWSLKAPFLYLSTFLGSGFFELMKRVVLK